MLIFFFLSLWQNVVTYICADISILLQNWVEKRRESKLDILNDRFLKVAFKENVSILMDFVSFLRSA